MAAVPAVPSTFTGGSEAIALLVLLSEFAMLRAPLSRSQVRLYAFQSLAVSGLSVFVAATRHVDELYGLAALSFVLKVIVVPTIMLRLLREQRVDLVGSRRLGIASMVMLALVAAAF